MPHYRRSSGRTSEAITVRSLMDLPRQVRECSSRSPRMSDNVKLTRSDSIVGAKKRRTTTNSVISNENVRSSSGHAVACDRQTQKGCRGGHMSRIDSSCGKAGINQQRRAEGGSRGREIDDKLAQSGLDGLDKRNVL